jgi:hypothetical protein
MPPDSEHLPAGRPIENHGRSEPIRPWIGILFECCGVYARVYRRPDQPYYSGRCPKCLRTMRIQVGEDGTPARQFRAF